MVTAKKSQTEQWRVVLADEEADDLRWTHRRNGVLLELRTAVGSVRYTGARCRELLGAGSVEVSLEWNEAKQRPTVADIKASGIDGATFATWARDFPAAAVEWDAIAWLTTATGPTDDDGQLVAGGTPTTFEPGTLSLVPGYVASLQRGGNASQRPRLDHRTAARDYLAAVKRGRGVFGRLAERWDCDESAARQRVRRLARDGYLSDDLGGDRRGVRTAGPKLRRRG